MNTVITQNTIAERIVEELKSRLANAWANALSDQERQVLQDISADAAELLIESLMAPQSPQSREGLDREAAHITAQLANVTAIAAAHAAHEFWSAVQAVAGRALAVAVSAAV